jgi:hypothetical protein
VSRLNLPALFALALALVAFACAYTITKPWPSGRRLAWIAAFTILSLPSILFAVYYLHVLPERAWFYELHAWRGAEWLLIFPGLAAGGLAAGLPRFLVAFPLFAVMLLGSALFIKPIIAPLEPLHDRWKGDACLQTTWATCGPASVSTILRHLGIPSGETEAAQAAHSYSGGTEAWYLARYVRSKGLQARFWTGEGFAPEQGLPAMVGVRLGGYGHFIAVLSVDGDRVTFADSMEGMVTLPLEKFRQRYPFTSFEMVVSQPH